ncbi:MAG: hypothetical protein PHW03_05265 [Eubacteriales bacterium]|nr:hypothetical protein [Eubacteriales bacterium]
MNIDLASLDTVQGSNAGFEVSIYNPATNEDLGVFITVLGKDSDEFQKVSRAQQKKRMAKMSKGGFRSNNMTLSPEEIEAEGISLLAAVSKKWRTAAVKEGEVITEPEKDTILIDGKELPFSIANAEMIYKRFPWIKEQVDTAVGDRANFIKT